MFVQGTYIVKTIPPLNINLASRGTAPDQNVLTPSFLSILAAHVKLFLYSDRASMDCILFIVSGLFYAVSRQLKLPRLDGVEGLCHVTDSCQRHL